MSYNKRGHGHHGGGGGGYGGSGSSSNPSAGSNLMAGAGSGSSAVPPGAATQRRSDSLHNNIIEVVQIEGLAVLKIIKHCQEEGGATSEAQGVLLGLLNGTNLEVTNCFPLPRHGDESNSAGGGAGGSDEADESEFQVQMLKHLRNTNVDHLSVGWYQSSPYGSILSKLETVDGQFMYQNSIEEAVVITYDPVKTNRGFLALKAYRLSNLAMKLCKEAEFTTEALKANKMSFEKFYEEVPLIIKNSHLVNALLCKMDSEMRVDEGKQLLELGGVGNLEKSLQCLMKSVDDVTKFANYNRNYLIRIQNLQMRQNRGEMTMTDEEQAKYLKPLPPLQRFEAFLNYSQALNFSNQTTGYASQNLTKLYTAQGLATAGTAGEK